MTAPPDPGWPAFGPALLPGGVQWYVRRHADDDQRRVLRAVWISFVEIVVVFGAVAVVVFRERPDGMAGGVPVVGGLALLVIAARVLDLPRRPVDCSSDDALAGWYRARFFLRTAFAMAVTLFGFVFTAGGGGPFPVLIGGITTLGLLAADVPSRANLERDDASLHGDGCGRSLIDALAAGGSPPGRP